MEHPHPHPHAHAGPAPLADVVAQLELPEQPRAAIDVGCGAGAEARWLAEAGFAATGIDVSEQAIATAQQRTGDDLAVRWVVARASALPAEDASCVLVTDRGCLHHLSAEEARAYAAEVARVLAPAGAWVIRDMLGHTHQHRELDEDSVRALARAAGLRLERFDVRQAAPGAQHAAASLVAVVRRD